MVVNVEPSQVIGRLITTLEGLGLDTGMKAAMERVAEFRNPLEAQLTGIALDPLARPAADMLLDKFWSEKDVQGTLSGYPSRAEVIVGSGFHAATYAAIRVQKGFPRPLVLERSTRVGGVFADSKRATFYLNSRNRPGGPGLAGDLGASLNHLPGGVIQATNIGMGEYQTNADMALVIRLTLAQYADVLPNVEVGRIDEDGDVYINNYGTFFARRVILARGLGDPRPNNTEFVLSFPAFMRRMASMWPMRGLRRVAVIGDGDSGKCAVESLLGLAPEPFMASAQLDHVERVDWYATNIPNTCEQWQTQVRGRYQGIGRYLRPDRFGTARLVIVPRFADATSLPDCAVIDGRSYDLVVDCTGNLRPALDGARVIDTFDVADEVVARYDDERQVYSIGPEAGIVFSEREREDGLAGIPGNSVAMFRLGTKTALLAATLD